MPEAGETITCRLFKGGKIDVTLEDRVYPDRSANQYEAGWWVYAETKQPHVLVEYFLNEAGILFTWDKAEPPETRGYTKACGIHVRWARIVKQADMELLKFATDEEINRSFDAYR